MMGLVPFGCQAKIVARPFRVFRDQLPVFDSIANSRFTATLTLGQFLGENPFRVGLVLIPENVRTYLIGVTPVANYNSIFTLRGTGAGRLEFFAGPNGGLVSPFYGASEIGGAQPESTSFFIGIEYIREA